MQTPHEFRPKTFVPVRNKIITTVGIILLSGIVGFGAGYAGSHLSNNANVTKLINPILEPFKYRMFLTS